jgi:acetate---CoA ligase (ADP-forming) subunit beta
MSPADVITAARSDGRTVLTEVESKELIQGAGVPVVPTRLASSREDAVAIAGELGYPSVLKVASPDILHKSDIGGVKVGLADADAVGRAYDEIMAAARASNPDARVHGVSVQPMAASGVEVIIGASKDPQFGPFLMFGLGGVLVEVLRDVAFRLVPLTPRDARQMVREIKGFPLLEGYRGTPPSDVAALEETLLKLSAFLDEHDEIKELDLNPVFAYPQGLSAVDARVILEEPA